MNISFLIADKFNRLPERAQAEVLAFIESLAKKYASISSGRKNKKSTNASFNFNWEGALAQHKKKFTAVELQHKATEWRSI